MVNGVMVLVDGVVGTLVVAGDHGPPSHVTVVLVAGVQQVAMEKEHIPRLHFHIVMRKHFQCLLDPATKVVVSLLSLLLDQKSQQGRVTFASFLTMINIFFVSLLCVKLFLSLFM